MTHALYMNFRHGGKLYRLSPDTRFLCAVEDELGALPLLARKFTGGEWRVSELVTLMQMFLQHCDETVDFFALGDALLREGLDAPLGVIRRFLSIFTAADDFAVHKGLMS